jgi:hypothetical protein
MHETADKIMVAKTRGKVECDGKKSHKSHKIQVSLFSKQQLAGTSGQIMSLFKTHALEPAHAAVPTALVTMA